MKRMMMILAMIACYLSEEAKAQEIVDRSADNGFLVRQLPGSEQKARDYFSPLLKAGMTDTIIATIFRPANCPRCDGFISKIHQQTKLSTPYSTLLIAVYPDSIAAEDYIIRNKLEADKYLYDTEEKFSEFLSFSLGYLHVGYILKIVPSSGQLIVGCNADNVSQDFFADLANYKDIKQPEDFNPDKKAVENVKVDIPDTLCFNRRYEFEFGSGITPSEVIYQPMFHDNHLLLNDKLLLATFETELDSDVVRLKRIVEPDSIEASKFSQLPADVYESLLSRNEIKNIPLQPFLMDSISYGIGYSLPELWIEEGGGIAYRNKPCILKKSFVDPGFSEVIPLNYDFEDEFYYPHFTMKTIGGEEVVTGVERLTWPLISDTAEFKGNPSMDPFMEEFYTDYEQPILAIYRLKDGKLDKRFGRLPSFAKNAKTGYSLTSSVFDSWNGESVYANVYDGLVNIVDNDAVDCDNCVTTYRLFDIPDIQSEDNSLFYSYSLVNNVEKQLERRIKEIKADDRIIHCVVAENSDVHQRPERERHYYLVIDRTNSKVREFAFPEQLKGERRVAYGLRRLENGFVEPYYISQTKDGNWNLFLP